MQDVGYLISYEGHHKHSYHLILHSRLEAFRPEELEIVANVARYHRGAEPKNKHANFRGLDARRSACACSRWRPCSASPADLIAATTRSSVRSKSTGTPDEVELVVAADEFPEVDLWAASRRADMFESVFDAKLGVAWAGAAAENGQPATQPAAAKNA